MPRPKGSKNKPYKAIPDRKEEVLKNLEATHGIIGPACKPVGITRWQLYKWIESDPDFAERYKEIKEASLDFVETKMYDLANKGNVQALMFMSRCLLGGRGWKYSDTEVKVENTTNNYKQINIIVQDNETSQLMEGLVINQKLIEGNDGTNTLEL